MTPNLPTDMKVFGPVNPPTPVDPRITGDIKDPPRQQDPGQRKKFVKAPSIGELCDAINILNVAAEEFPAAFTRIVRDELFVKTILKEYTL